jgi:hypothetical protein
MCMNPDELKAFALVHDPHKRILYEVDAQPTGSTVRMTNVAAPVDDPPRRWTGTSIAPQSRRSTSTRR